MNCDSCEVPKNSLIDATTGRMLIRVCGVIASTSCVVIRSRTTRSIRARPRRTWFWMSSPTRAQTAVAEVVDVVDLDDHRRRLAGRGIESSPACSRTMYSMVATMSSSVSVPCVISASTPSFLLIL